MKKITLTCLMLMFVGSMFAQVTEPLTNADSWYYPQWWVGAYPGNNAVTCYLYIDDILQEGYNYEIGAYDMDEAGIERHAAYGYNNVCGRGLAQYSPNMPHTFYQVMHTSDAGHLIQFKVYDHNLGEELDLVCSYEYNFLPDVPVGSVSNPLEMRFYSPEGRDLLFTNIEDNAWSTLTNWTINGETAGSLPNSLDRATINGICVVTEDDAPAFASLTIKDGAQFYAPEDSQITATVEKEIAGYAGNNGNWYLIANPGWEKDEPFGFANAGLFEGGNYDFFFFDQTYPGPSVEDDEDYDIDNGEWRNYKYYEADPEVGSFAATYGGYLYANSQDVTLHFTTLLNTDSEVSYNKLPYVAGSDDISLGLNLVGNPFACNALAEYGTKCNGFFVMNTDRTDVVPADNNIIIAPTTALFVKSIAKNNTAASITFTPTIEEALVRSMAYPRLNIEVRSDNGSLEDRTYVRNYESEDLVKFSLRNDGTKIYIPQNGKKYAAVYAGEAKVMPINFTSNEGGIHTISVMAENMNCSYLHLIDNVTGADIDMLRTPKYSFNADDSNYATRFKLVFDEQATDEIVDNFAFISNGELMINNSGNATLQVMDITGRILSTENIQNCYSKSLNLSAGVYVVRLSNGNDVKAQKIVVE